MATTLIDPDNSHGAEVVALQPVSVPTSGFEIEFSSGARRIYSSEMEIRDAVLEGGVPKDSLIRKVGGSADAKPTTVELWARSVPKLKSLYTPVWTVTGKGALLGLCVVGILKALDTLIGIASVNPGAAFVWLLFGAGMLSPKWKLPLLGGAIYLSFQSGINFNVLWGAWMGVLIFAAVFGTSSGMVIGTIIGYFRARKLPNAPDATGEGRKPLVLGLLTPLAVFAIAAGLYIQVLLPAALNLVSRR